MQNMIPIISIVGKTNSGKTSLIEKIIPELKKRGYRIGTIKHDVHQFEVDHEGKDTWRMTQAGADIVIIASGEKMAMMKKNDREYKINELSQWLLEDVDIVITEGYKQSDKPKIEVTCSGELICNKDDNLFAVVFNMQQVIDLNVPCFVLDDILPIVNLIEKNFLRA